MYVTPKSPKGWQRRRFCCFCQYNSTFVERSLLQSFFVLCENFQRQLVVATPFFYLTVHRRIAGDVPIYLKFALKVTHPFRKRQFRQISLNSASTARASKEVQLSLIGSRQCAFHRATDEPCALPLSPQRVAKDENFYILRCLSYLRCS